MPSEDRLKELWSKATAASDPAEVESLFMEFRDALHERMEQLREEAKKVKCDSDPRTGVEAVVEVAALI
jgi:hypothetical protein